MHFFKCKFRFLLFKWPYTISSHHLHLESKNIRQEFVNFFTNKHDHVFLRSSPVVPFCDSSVPFVNAGMNQFKGVFLGQCKPPFRRVANSQKCIRVGGKHNDLECVGSDTHHHTFFEMLGNWSFGDYFKERACKMAWELLTGPYNLNPDQLYVTYYKGDKDIGIEADTETRDIWLDIGVPPERILAYGSRENFWEMGPSGPCGPCTEIHYDHENGRFAPERVNQGFDDLVEIWNLVFIQYNRNIDGSLKRLPSFHVDTGMGLERLVAILQGKRSNYDTDLFLPLFSSIQKVTGAPVYSGSPGKIDTEYRILADHTRMITVALADGIFPDQNFKLRRILQRALNIAKNTFHCKKGLVVELTNHVAATLVDAYPEVGAKLKQIQLMINHEEEILETIQKTVCVEWGTLIQDHEDLRELEVETMPGIIKAFKELEIVVSSKEHGGTVPHDLSFMLYDTFGLNKKTIEILYNHFGLQMDQKHFESCLLKTKKESRESNSLEYIGNDVADSVKKHLIEKNLQHTDDSFKYLYHKEDNYVFPHLESEIQAIVLNNQCVSHASGVTCDLILNRTNFYHESGGQLGDRGFLILDNTGTQIEINNITNIQGFLFHNINVPENCTLSLGDRVTLKVIPEIRLGCMRNHTATHLVNAVLHRLLTATCQKSSRVSKSSFKFEFAVYGEKFGIDCVKEVEELVNTIVRSAVPVKRETVDSQKLYEMYIANKITLVPGEVYPQDKIHIIEIAHETLTSREACCGTHVFNTADIGDFCITMLKSPASGTCFLSAVTGNEAADAIAQGIQVSKDVLELKNSAYHLMENSSTVEEVEYAINQVQIFKQSKMSSDKVCVPYTVRTSCLEDLNELSKKLKGFRKTFFREILECEMQRVLQQTNQPFIVHYLQCSESMDDVPLQKATKMCSELPVLLIADSGGTLKAKCCVPKKIISEDFNAKIWLEHILPIFTAQGFVPRGQDCEEVYNMKKKYVKEDVKSILINDAIISAREFAKKSIHST